jgi:hypothetical protein
MCDGRRVGETHHSPRPCAAPAASVRYGGFHPPYGTSHTKGLAMSDISDHIEARKHLIGQLRSLIFELFGNEVVMREEKAYAYLNYHLNNTNQGWYRWVDAPSLKGREGFQTDEFIRNLPPTDPSDRELFELIGRFISKGSQKNRKKIEDFSRKVRTIEIEITTHESKIDDLYSKNRRAKPEHLSYVQDKLPKPTWLQQKLDDSIGFIIRIAGVIFLGFIVYAILTAITGSSGGDCVVGVGGYRCN